MKANSLIHTKEKIILESINVIHEFGIHSLSTREVARRIGITEPAIFKHYKTKSDLILAILDHFSQYDADILQSISTRKVSPLEAIRESVDTIGSYYSNYPAITALTQNYDILQNDVIYKEKVKFILNTRTNFVSEMIEKAKQIGDIRKEIDSHSMGIAIVGTLRELCLHWRMNEYNFSLRDAMISSVETLLALLK